MTYRLRFTATAHSDLERLYRFLADQDIDAAENALTAIDNALEMLCSFPFACRKAGDTNPFLRELLISFGDAGYVALFEIENDTTVTVLAVRHQREEDYY